MKYSDLFSCMEYIIIWSRFPRREKWLETPKDAVCYASMGEDGEDLLPGPVPTKETH